ncbi:MAG: cysteine synthase A [Actinomycetaceae bacterium]|nr:cysteine synthase A [Actinomycetaceae bacterium]
MFIASSVTDLIGNTPLVKINKLAGSQATVLAKLEMLNPGSSVKDRIAVAIIDAAERSGKLPQGGTIVEATSGNTGVGLAMVGAARGYKVVIAMPESMSKERRVLMRAFGADLLLTPASGGMSTAVSAAEEYVRDHEGAVLASQFTNPANPAIHAATTGAEILGATRGKIDVLVAGIGTGGTISGVGRMLKEANPNIRVIALEPEESPLLSEGKAGPHGIQGLGANFIPEILDRSVIDEILRIKTADAIATARKAASEEGLLVGISSGAALHGAVTVAQRPEMAGKTIVTLLPDTGERYLSTVLFAELAD